MNEQNNFNNQLNGGLNNQVPQQPIPNPQNNQGQSFNNFNGMQGNMMNQTNGFNNQMPQQPNSNMPVNNFGQQQQPGQFQNGPMPTPMNNQLNNNNGQQKKSNTDKIIVIVVGIIVALGIISTFLTGKTLTCTRHTTLFEMPYDDTLKVKFNDGKVKKIEQTVTMDLGKNISKKDEFINAMKEDYEEEKVDGFSYSVSSKDTKITFKLTSSSKDAIEKFYYLDEDDDYDSIKKELISEEYTCK